MNRTLVLANPIRLQPETPNLPQPHPNFLCTATVGGFEKGEVQAKGVPPGFWNEGEV